MLARAAYDAAPILRQRAGVRTRRAPPGGAGRKMGGAPGNRPTAPPTGRAAGHR
ncbi:hypothetical protein SCATT_54210 [Streptantibioticus cattleyicolor NRRL 8057 = DSM 46488]|uniref:Uncharacterized protein n=1 Tax=Streptantibioticus cattleyicolor (strain ATCC 35852 / DSM 46488 / JCM 4925 / NBRC 14057 / NRRL 8057) TaxID=1003195 RepID=G8WVN5_STREN|nr:hypothetical protein SCATT_54210 [Streptantibioticus cattleyicolor NRRL 8057 = DSM 46488]